VLANRTVKWSAGTAALCAVLLITTWFLLIAPRQGHVAETRAAEVAAQQANDVLKAKVQQLRAQFADLPKTQAELAALHRQLTPAADLPGVVRSVSALSTAAGTTLESLSPGAPTVLGGAAKSGGGPAAAAAAAVADPAAGAGAAAGAGSGAGAGAAGGGRVVSIPLVLVVTGDYYQVVGFIRRIQTEMPRALLISGIQIDQDPAGGQVRLSLTGQVFTLPDQGKAAASGGAASGGAAAGGASGATPANGAVSASGSGAGAGSNGQNVAGSQ